MHTIINYKNEHDDIRARVENLTRVVASGRSQRSDSASIIADRGIQPFRVGVAILPKNLGNYIFN